MKKAIITVITLALGAVLLGGCAGSGSVLSQESSSIVSPKTSSLPISSQISASVQSELSESLSSQKNVNPVLYYTNLDISGNTDSKTVDQILHNTIFMENTLSENQIESQIRETLQKAGTYKKTPDNVMYDNGKPLVDFYTDKTKGEMSFVLYLSGSGIVCTSMNVNDFQKIGYLGYTYDEQQRTTHESLFDNNEKQTASIDYQYLNGAPFPFITKYVDTSNREDIAEILNTNQKFWIDKDNAIFDQSGKWSEYTADIYKSNTDYHFLCSYDKNGNLIKITGELDKKVNPTNAITLNYQKSGLLGTVEYYRSNDVYGTSDSSGEIHYDDQGRMIYREYYLTHGPQYVFYLYNGAEKRPWIKIDLDSEIADQLKEGVYYGNMVNVYLFGAIQ